MTTITVTDRHIEDGIPGNCRRCAIALAMMDVIDPRIIVQAGLMEVVLFVPPDRTFVWNGWLPQYVIDFIIERDQGHVADLRPRTFAMDIPQQYLRPELRTIEERRR